MSRIHFPTKVQSVNLHQNPAPSAQAAGAMMGQRARAEKNSVHHVLTALPENLEQLFRGVGRVCMSRTSVCRLAHTRERNVYE